MKALFRRATAANSIGRFDDCIRDADRLLELKAPVELQRQVLSLRRGALELRETDRHVSAREIMPSSFVSPQQVIKLVFNEPLSDLILPDVEYTTRLSLCNEFGLFSRTLMPTDGTRIALVASAHLLHHGSQHTQNHDNHHQLN